MKATFALAVLTLSSCSFGSGQQVPVSAPNAMVACSEPFAAEAGLGILRKGGNAYDAAVAIGFALAVTYPRAGNLGGGGFFVGLPKRGGPAFLDFRETAPAAATKDMFLDANGNPQPEESIFGYKSIGVPGTVDGLVALQARYGKLTLPDDVRPAMLLARLGFTVSQNFHDSLVRALAARPKIAETATLYYPDGNPLTVGSTFIQGDLADTLERISDQGRLGFYSGPTAQMIAQDMDREGGLITEADLKSYHSKWRGVLSIHSGGYELLTPSLPSSGGVTMAEILGMVDLNALKSDGKDNANYVQMLTEAERLAYADRNYYLGDSDFAHPPVDQLTSSKYLQKRKALMPNGHAGNSKDVKQGDPEKMETTHFCVVDKDGNVAAITYTLNGLYGMQAMVPGAGFLLNDEMDDFTSKPGSANMFGLVQGEPNAIQPHKRPLSSMTPTIILKDGKFFATIGSPGGSTIITNVLQTYLNLSLFNMNIRDAIDAGRFHHQYLPDVIEYENGDFSPSEIDVLEGMGYHLHEVSQLGDVNGIMRMPDGTLQGWSDHRNGDGKAVGY
ncbi:MAG TPA: gamma-glutamyltransferase [Fimbriimonadaceae bacterium]|jgi:gamma-glutamyltranspeptidase/glutathione hydrolase